MEPFFNFDALSFDVMDFTMSLAGLTIFFKAARADAAEVAIFTST